MLNGNDPASLPLVWHYTTLDSLQLILESGSLMATEVSYQNDPREPETANEVIHEALQTLQGEKRYAAFATDAIRWRKQEHDSNGFIMGDATGALINGSRFIFCASVDPDNLYAWRTYAAGSQVGCAIGLDPLVPLGVVSDTDQADVPMTSWRPVIYGEDELLAYATDRLRAVGDVWNAADAEDQVHVRRQVAAGVPHADAASDPTSFAVLVTDLASAASEVTAVAKHASFRDERETRLTVPDASFAVTFSPGRSGPRPRIRLGTAARWGQVVSTDRAPLPIRAITIAPNASRDAARTAQWLLLANGYPLDPVAVFDEDADQPTMRWDSTPVIKFFTSTHPYRDV
ncbi:hypothetical protein [Microbacterium oleivorans]|uniref:hypothetical protein n=1 Tax=Microbacterium oleivorans TaxID=273677 RepID=UPI001404E4B9|nr:hypothetical protein [Microbacterium oleivorans]